jgi:hypothetical protein
MDGCRGTRHCHRCNRYGQLHERATLILPTPSRVHTRRHNPDTLNLSWSHRGHSSGRPRGAANHNTRKTLTASWPQPCRLPECKSACVRATSRAVRAARRIPRPTPAVRQPLCDARPTGGGFSVVQDAQVARTQIRACRNLPAYGM